MSRIAHGLRRLGAVAAGLLLLLAALIGWSEWHGNFHTVLPGELYRSGQLSAPQLKQHLRTEGIRSILNLRGAAPDKEWYTSERSLARRHGVRHVDFELSASQALGSGELDELVEVLRGLPKPVLIHCLGGADRTSLVSALYLYAVKGESASRAAAQLSVRFGHFPYLFRSEVAAMDESLRRYISEDVVHLPDNQ